MTFETLHNDMVAAMKARDKARKAVISTLIADVKKAAIDAGTRDDISEALVDQVILKSKKTAREQLDRYEQCPDCSGRRALKFSQPSYRELHREFQNLFPPPYNPP